ncbi:MAG: SDR family oxidoreductase [Bacteroidota bacterium]|nr:SDR family oxidoreductase [Bacteroidota bacterium]
MESNKVILITGSRKGIGRGLAEYYLEKKYFVVGCSRLASDLSHSNYLHFTLDISDELAVKKMMISVKDKFGKLDILINNAGIASMNHVLLTPLSTVIKLFETNFLGTFLCSREAVKLMQKKKFGRIVNLTSIAVPLQLEGEAIYASSKSAVEQLTKNMAKELGVFGITMNAIGPTPIETDLIKAVPKNKIEDLLDKQTIKRYGNLNDIINIVEFFISPNSSFITGQILYLGGIVK